MSQPEQHEPEHQYPRSWDWQAEGSTVDGTYIKLTTGTTAHGPAPILGLLIDGEERSLWILWAGLKSKLAQELKRRGTSEFNKGERIVITRFPMRESKVNPSQTTVPFVVEFRDEPAASAASILGVGPSEPAAATEPELLSDDSIPFC